MREKSATYTLESKDENPCLFLARLPLGDRGKTQTTTSKEQGIVDIKLASPLVYTIQYTPWALQHLHGRKLRAIWRISTKNPRKKLACKFLHELLHADFLHANLSVFLRWLILLTKIHASCMYFFTTQNVADIQCGWCKIRHWHCGKTSFCGERENNLLYTFSYYDHATIANVMFCYQRFPWLLTEALFYMSTWMHVTCHDCCFEISSMF